jgi:ADP-ribose pyrophosphatase
MQDDTVVCMATKSTRSRIESAGTSTAKPIASPRAQAHRSAPPAKRAAHPAHRVDPESPEAAGARNGKPAAAPKKSPAKASGKSSSKSSGKARLLKSEVAYKGKIINVYRDTVLEPNGKEATREVVRHSGSVVILASDDSSDPNDPTLILIRQYRHAAGQFLIELPAGRIDAGEPPLAAAKREMIEETGFRARRWTRLVNYFASPGFLGESMTIFVARDLRPGDATPEEDEQIEILPTPLSKALELIAEGSIHDGKTLIGLSLFDQARRAGRL